MRLTFLGVRGSTSAPGAAFVRYGGHTSCVAVTHSDADRPSLLLDAGTGIRLVPELLGGQPFDGSMLLTHLHWDHVQGLPFFHSADRPDARAAVWLPHQDDCRSGEELLAQQFSPPAFPIPPAGLLGAWDFHAIEPGGFASEGFDIRALEVAHKGGRTFGYQIACGGSVVAYLPDHAPAFGVSDETRAELAGVDVLVHDAQFAGDERERADAYGHATIGDAVALAESLGVGQLVLTHHAPHRTDDEIDQLAGLVTSRVPWVMAREGLVIDLP